MDKQLREDILSKIQQTEITPAWVVTYKRLGAFMLCGLLLCISIIFATLFFYFYALFIGGYNPASDIYFHSATLGSIFISVVSLLLSSALYVHTKIVLTLDKTTAMTTVVALVILSSLISASILFNLRDNPSIRNFNDTVLQMDS